MIFLTASIQELNRVVDAIQSGANAGIGIFSAMLALSIAAYFFYKI